MSEDKKRFSIKKFLLKSIWGILILFSGTVYLIFSLWCFGVIWFLLPFLPQFFAFVFAAIVLACGVGFFIKKIRFVSWLTALVLYLLVFVLWFSIRPTNDLEWQTPWKRMPEAHIDGNKVTINNVRDFIYRSENDYTVNYITETYDLDKIQDLRLITSFWDGNTLICHMLLDFGFSDGKRVVLSVETRLPVGVKQDWVAGLYKQYGVLMILGTESDLVMLRTNYRKEEVFVYPTRSKPEKVRELFVLLLKGINKLREKPKFYNTLTTNCTTALIPFVRAMTHHGEGWKLWLILNGLYPEKAFNSGWFKHLPHEDFESYRKRCHITSAMQKCNDRNKYTEMLNKLYAKDK